MVQVVLVSIEGRSGHDDDLDFPRFFFFSRTLFANSTLFYARKARRSRRRAAFRSLVAFLLSFLDDLSTTIVRHCVRRDHLTRVGYRNRFARLSIKREKKKNAFSARHGGTFDFEFHEEALGRGSRRISVESSVVSGREGGGIDRWRKNKKRNRNEESALSIESFRYEFCRRWNFRLEILRFLPTLIDRFLFY